MSNQFPPTVEFDAVKHRGWKRSSVFCSILLILAIYAVGCRNGSTNNASSGSGTTAGQEVAGQSGGAASSPSPVPTNPTGPTGQTTPSGQPDLQPDASADQRAKMGNIPATTAPAGSGMKSSPDPFPPRPTPTIVMKDGKIVQQWQAPSEALSLTNPFKDSPDAVRLGREFYMQRCVDCHGKEGKGNGWLSKGVFKPPTNLASTMVQANSDGELYWKITNGRSPMPANRIRFTDEQRWQIVSFMRTFKP